MPSSDCDISHGMRAGILEGANSYSIDPVFFTSEGPIWPELLPPFGPRVFPGDMGPPTYPGGWFKEEFVGEPLATFTIVSAPSLSSTWTFRTNVTSDIYGRAEFTLATGGSNNLFYRTTVTNVP
jgi:hypothetical protein